MPPTNEQEPMSVTKAIDILTRAVMVPMTDLALAYARIAALESQLATAQKAALAWKPMGEVPELWRDLIILARHCAEPGLFKFVRDYKTEEGWGEDDCPSYEYVAWAYPPDPAAVLAGLPREGTGG